MEKIKENHENISHDTVESKDELSEEQQWRYSLVEQAIHYDFIKDEDRKEAINIVSKYKDDLQLLENEKTENSVGLLLALASQI